MQELQKFEGKNIDEIIKDSNTAHALIELLFNQISTRSKGATKPPNASLTSSDILNIWENDFKEIKPAGFVTALELWDAGKINPISTTTLSINGFNAQGFRALMKAARAFYNKETRLTPGEISGHELASLKFKNLEAPGEGVDLVNFEDFNKDALKILFSTYFNTPTYEVEDFQIRVVAESLSAWKAYTMANVCDGFKLLFSGGAGYMERQNLLSQNAVNVFASVMQAYSKKRQEDHLKKTKAEAEARRTNTIGPDEIAAKNKAAHLENLKAFIHSVKDPDTFANNLPIVAGYFRSLEVFGLVSHLKDEALEAQVKTDCKAIKERRTTAKQAGLQIKTILSANASTVYKSRLLIKAIETGQIEAIVKNAKQILNA